MNRSDFLNELKTTYDLVKTMSSKESGSVLLLRHKTQKKNIVFRSYSNPCQAYEELKSIKHQNLPEIYDTYTLDDGQVVIEEYIDGITVGEVLENGNYTPSGAKKVLTGVCLALEVLHSKNIVHRDVKPENVMIDNSGNVKLIDLNASRKHVPESKKDTLVLGTIGYASPEQYGISQSDAKSDVYSLGILLNVMLTGEHPSSKLAKGKAGKIVLKCTQIDPNKRFESVEKLLSVL